MSREYEVPNVAERLGLGNRLAKTPAIVYLTDVVAFVDWLGERDSKLRVAAALQGLGGQSVMETLRLTWDKVNLEFGPVEIGGEVKNVYRNRVIPVCGNMLDVLKSADERRPRGGVQSMSEAVVLSPTGCSYTDGVRSWNNFGRNLSRLIRAWNAEIRWAPKDLRNCLPAFANSQGVHTDVWEQYIGHAPRTVTARHYLPRMAAGSLGEREALKRQMDLFRKQVVKPLRGRWSRIHRPIF